MDELKSDYKDALLVELIRYIQLERDDWDDSSEFDHALRSVWYLLNPLELDDRSKIITDYFVDKEDEYGPYKCKMKFTAHSHHNEPLNPSPDDIIVYNRLDLKFSSHFITDRFNIVKIDPTRPYRSYFDLHKPDKNGVISFVIGEEETL